jgi:hypothetical protein
MFKIFGSYGMLTYSDHGNMLWSGITALCLVGQLLMFGWFIFSKFKMANTIFSSTVTLF